MNVIIISDNQQEFNGKIYKRYKNSLYYTRSSKYLHREVWLFHNGAIPDGYHVHHKDHDRDNNDMSNLECIPKQQHLSEHMTPERRAWASKNVVEKAMPAARKWHQTEEGKKLHHWLGTVGSKKGWANKKWYTKRCQICEVEYKTPFPERSKYCGDKCRHKANR